MMSRGNDQSPRTAYVLKVWPRFSQTFVVNEVLAHEAAGLPLDIISMRLSDDVRFHESLSRVRSRVTQVKRPPAKSSAFLAWRSVLVPTTRT